MESENLIHRARPRILHLWALCFVQELWPVGVHTEGQGFPPPKSVCTPRAKAWSLVPGRRSQGLGLGAWGQGRAMAMAGGGPYQRQGLRPGLGSIATWVIAWGPVHWTGVRSLKDLLQAFKRPFTDLLKALKGLLKHL